MPWFEDDEACEFGVPEAIMIQSFRFWIKKNRANDHNFNDGRTWTYNKIAAFPHLFPYWTPDQLRRTLERLQDKGVLITGNYNKTLRDRTCWYAFADEKKFLREMNDGGISDLEPDHLANLPNANGKFAKCKRQKSQMDMANLPNGYGKNAISITVSNTSIIPDIKPISSETDLFFDEFWKRYKPTSDWNGKRGIQGSKTKAKKVFEKLIKDGESPIYIVFGAVEYLKRIEGNRQSVHAEHFLRDKMWEEFIEEEIAKREKEMEKVEKEQKKHEKLTKLSADPFWLQAQEEFAKEETVPEKWRVLFGQFTYFGQDSKGSHVIHAPSLTIANWYNREYTPILTKILGKFLLPY